MYYYSFMSDMAIPLCSNEFYHRFHPQPVRDGDESTSDCDSRASSHDDES